jgi:hypothetical protein
MPREPTRPKLHLSLFISDQAGKGRIVFPPERATLRVFGPSACLREGFEVMFENELYHEFEIDLVARSTRIDEPIRVPSVPPSPVCASVNWRESAIIAPASGLRVLAGD